MSETTGGSCARAGDALRLGVIGMSDGNGHPFSWAAICNGYDRAAMASCPFPVIPRYLAKQRFPEAQLAGARVTHIWTQDPELSRHVAAAALVPNVVKRFTDMLGHVDGLLLARDDAENHLQFARPFLEAGMPIYLDKPPALCSADLDTLYGYAIEPWQVFSCSALRYAVELLPSPDDLERIGPITHVCGNTPKSWARYAAHLVDPAICVLTPGRLEQANAVHVGARTVVSATWSDGTSASFVATGKSTGDIALTYVGAHGSVHRVFSDSFHAFRAALAAFVRGVECRRSESPRAHLAQIVEMVQAGVAAVPAPMELEPA